MGPFALLLFSILVRWLASRERSIFFKTKSILSVQWLSLLGSLPTCFLHLVDCFSFAFWIFAKMKKFSSFGDYLSFNTIISTEMALLIHPAYLINVTFLVSVGRLFLTACCSRLEPERQEVKIKQLKNALEC